MAAANVSVVIPARNAAETLTEAIESLQAQTLTGWEAVVVEDGSTDGTAELARALARTDSRIVVVDGAGRGVSAARNAGIERARYPLLAFLDADDLIRPTLYEHATARLERDAALAGVHCGWARLAPGGEIVDAVPAKIEGDLFTEFARHCLFPIHACVVRTDLVRSAGAFDERLTTCEDWDLWLRVTRYGRPFAAIQAVLALYRMRPRSASLDAPRLLADGLGVIAQARRPDPRVQGPVAHERGLASDDLAVNGLNHACWTAGLAIGSGVDPEPLLDAVRSTAPIPAEPLVMAGCLFASTVLPRCLTPADWTGLADELRDPIDSFLTSAEEVARLPGLASRVWRRLEEKILAASPRGVATRIGTSAALDIEVTEPLADIEVADGVERLVCRIALEGEPFGVLGLPACDGLLPGAVLADAIAGELGWSLLTRFLTGSTLPSLALRDRGTHLEVVRGSTPVGRVPPGTQLGPAVLNGPVGWAVFLQELFDRPEWPPEWFYHPPRPSRHGRPRSEATVELSGEISPMTPAPANPAVVMTLGGAPLGLVTVQCRDGGVAPERLVAQAVRSAGVELALVAVREALVGRPLRSGGALRARLQAAAERERAEPAAPQELVLARRQPLDIGGPASRSYALPVGAASELLESARATDEPVVKDGSFHTHVRYAPELIRALPVVPAPRRAPLRRRLLARARVRRTSSATQVTRELPILMYHSVDESGAEALARYRITPARFEEHLRYLRDEGFRSVTFGELGEAMRLRRPLPGRCVLVTFDDGCADFLEHAQPLLAQYGFTATLFVVTDRVGATNSWDAAYGDVVELLDWDALRELTAAGVAIGSHSATHPYLTSLSSADVVREAARSRAAIARELGVAPVALAYPYGDVDAIVRHLAGGCGYPYAVTTEGRHAALTDNRLALPRIEVPGWFTALDLADVLNGPRP